MKISLSSENGIDILTASGTISVRDVLVMKAGIVKMIGEGKSKLIIELSENEPLADDVIPQLSALDAVASELLARVVIVSDNPELKTRIETLAKPPVIPCFENRIEAQAHFEAILKALDKTEAPPVPTASSGADPALLEEKERETQALRDQLRDMEINQLGTLRKQISQFENENKALMEQLTSLIIQRRSPPDEAAYHEKIQFLETKVQDLMIQMAEMASQQQAQAEGGAGSGGDGAAGSPASEGSSPEKK